MSTKPNPITLGQLLQYSNSPTEIVQIVEGSDWDKYSELPADSGLLKPFYDYLIVDLEAVSTDVIRVAIKYGAEEQ